MTLIDVTDQEFITIKIHVSCILCKNYYPPFCKLHQKLVEGLDRCQEFDCKYGKPIKQS